MFLSHIPAAALQLPLHRAVLFVSQARRCVISCGYWSFPVSLSQIIMLFWLGWERPEPRAESLSNWQLHFLECGRKRKQHSLCLHTPPGSPRVILSLTQSHVSVSNQYLLGTYHALAIVLSAGGIGVSNQIKKKKSPHFWNLCSGGREIIY